MTRDEVRHQLERLNLYFDKFKMSQTTFNTWVDVFKPYSEKVFERAIDEVIKNEEFTPSIATVRRYCKEIEVENRLIMDKAKECYLRAISALGIEKNMDEYKAFLGLINTEDRSRRIDFADELCSLVINFANKQLSEGKKNISFIELLKDISKRYQKNAD